VGAEPLFFLDYYACGQLQVDEAADVIRGIAKGCQLSGCALIGGETAEMPGMYAQGDYDLAGFVVGAVEKDAAITGENIQQDDVIIGIASSGPHSNGYSLIRKILERENADLNQALGETTLGQSLLQPTQIYVKPLLQLLDSAVEVNGMAHITGGGLQENISRVIPGGLAISIETQNWELLEIFNWLQTKGQLSDAEMYRTFNCGIGMVIIINKSDSEDCQEFIENAGLRCWEIGVVRASEDGKDDVEFL